MHAWNYISSPWLLQLKKLGKVPYETFAVATWQLSCLLTNCSPTCGFSFDFQGHSSTFSLSPPSFCPPSFPLSNHPPTHPSIQIQSSTFTSCQHSAPCGITSTSTNFGTVGFHCVPRLTHISNILSNYIIIPISQSIGWYSWISTTDYYKGEENEDVIKGASILEGEQSRIIV